MKLFVTILLLILSFNLYSQKLLKNINPGTDNSNPKDLITIGLKSFFLAYDNLTKLYYYDRITNNTKVVKQNVELHQLSDLFEFNQEFFVWGTTFQDGKELYKYDNSTDSLVLFKSFYPGQESGILRQIVKGQNKFYIFFDNPHELWVSDGTTVNTIKILNTISPNLDSKLCVGDNLFFINATIANGKELWFSNGTETGTYMVKDIFPGPTDSYINEMSSIGNNLIFNAYTLNENHELWISDGSEINTHIVQEIVPGTSGSFPNTFLKYNNEVYFSANGQQMYKTNGTVITFLGNIGFYDKNNFSIYNGELYFIGFSTEYGHELWKTNGTPEGTSLVADIYPGQQSGFPNITKSRSNFEIINNQLIFRATNGINGLELMKFDGNSVSLIKDIVSGASESQIGKLYKVGNEIITTGVSVNEERELWVTDGTLLGTQLIKNINPNLGLSNTFPLGVNDNALIFVAFTDSLGFEPWKYNSITKNISILSDIAQAPRRTFQNFFHDFNMQPIGNKYIFWANDGKHGNELWVTDGSTNGTYLLKDFMQFSYGYYVIGEPYVSYLSSTYLNSWARFNNEIYLVVNNKELWKIDSNLNLHLLLDLGNESIGGHTQVKLSMVNTSNKLYFTIGPNRYLYQTDGTPIGTYQIDFQTTLINLYGMIGSELIFSGNLYPYGKELFKNQNGVTTLIKDINGNESSSIKIVENLIISIDNKFIFEANNGTQGSELWVTDGTEAGTILLKDFNNGSGSSSFVASNFKKIGNEIVFQANDGLVGNEVWKTNGTPLGTVLVKDISEGSSSSIFEQFSFLIDSTFIVYQLDNGQNGLEPWITDGTNSNTRMLYNYTTDNGRSFIDPAQGIQMLNNELFFIINNNFWITDLSTGLARIPQFIPNSNTKNGSVFKFKNNIFCFASDFDGEHKIYLYKYESGNFKRQIGFNLNLKNNQPFLIFYPNLLNNKLIFKIFYNDEEYYVFDMCDEVVNVTTDILNGGTEKANILLNSSSKILTSQNVNFTSEKSIILNPGFKTNNFGVFSAQIKGCIDLN